MERQGNAEAQRSREREDLMQRLSICRVAEILRTQGLCICCAILSAISATLRFIPSWLIQLNLHLFLNSPGVNLSQQRLHYVPMHISQPIVATLETVGQPRVIHAKQM